MLLELFEYTLENYEESTSLLDSLKLVKHKKPSNTVAGLML